MSFHVRWKNKEITDPELLKKILKNTVIARIDIGYVSREKSKEKKIPLSFPHTVFRSKFVSARIEKKQCARIRLQ